VTTPAANTGHRRQFAISVSCGLLCLLIAARYAHFLWVEALNIPFADDILDVLQVLLGVLRAEHWAEAFEVLAAQHNDHRTLSSRLVYLLVYAVQGEINFRSLVFIANLALPALAAILSFSVSERTRRWPALVVILLVLLQLRAYGIVLWPMAAFAYFWVYLWGFACLALLHSLTPLRFVLALLAALLATFTLASGQLTWLLGAAGLAHQVIIQRRVRAGWLAAWLLATAVALWAWRLGLETPNTMAGVLGHLAATPGHHIAYFFILLGNVFSESSDITAGMGGAALLAMVLASSWKNWRAADIRPELCCWLIIASTAAMVLGRAHISPLEYALSSRYSFPSTLLLASVWVLLLNRLPQQRWRWFAGAAVLAAVFWVTSWSIYSVALQPHVEKRIARFDHKVYWVYGHPTRETNAIVAEAIAAHIYQPPPRPYPAPPRGGD